MKKIMFLMVLVVLLVVPMVSYAESAQEKSENDNIKLYVAAETNKTCAHETKSSGDSCCQDTAGNTKGYCPEGYPIFKDVITETCPHGTCYKYLIDCTKAGWGFCYTCSSCE